MSSRSGTARSGAPAAPRLTRGRRHLPAGLGRGYRYLLVGGVTGVLSLLTSLVWPAVWLATVAGPGRRAWRPMSAWTARLSGYERHRASELMARHLPGAFVPVGPGTADSRRQVLRRGFGDRGFRSTVGWLPVHGLLAPISLLLAAGQPVSCVLTFVLSARWLLSGQPEPYGSSFFFTVDSAPLAVLATVLALVLTALVLYAVPWLVRAQARLAGALLSAPLARVLAARVAELTATRAAALEAHGAELRRIERDLHDGAQARMAAVVMQLGIAERSLAGDPRQALDLIRRARDTATDSLEELRGVVRSIYPPVLDDRGLAGAVSALAARCPIPCTVRSDGVERAPTAVEVAAYFVVAESLGNVAKHSRARHVDVTLRTEDGCLLVEICDDGQGGADEGAGSGLAGIRRRAEAFDGRVLVSSPDGGPTRISAELPCA